MSEAEDACIGCFRKAVDRLPTLPLPKGIDLRTDGGNATRVAAVADSGHGSGRRYSRIYLNYQEMRNFSAAARGGLIFFFGSGPRSVGGALVDGIVT